MQLAKARGAVVALLISFSTSSVWAQGYSDDEPSIEPEIINVGSLAPGSGQAQPRLILPRPHVPLHSDENDLGAAHVRLGDIPFSATRSTASTESLWERIRGAFGMQELPSPLVKDWENWYASRPDYVARMIARGERYLFYVVEEVEKRGMPTEVALLPMIESAYNPTAYSTAQASGMWQFIPSTGKNYGLKQNWWQDERRDVLAGTRAALDYLEKLYEMFGSWELALASYNWGEGAVARAIQKNEARGLPTDYMSLDMPAETRNYIPKLMAVKNLIARPENYGLALAEIQNRPYFTVVTTDRNIDVKLAAKLADVPVEEFKALNPSHNRPVIRADVNQPILLPADRAERFQSNLEAHGTSLVSWQPYTIAKEDRLDRIAQRFGIDLVRLKEVNSISPRLRSLVGLTILVPANGEQSDADVSAAGFAVPTATAATIAPSSTKHVVKPGETLAAIAHRYGLSVAQLATRNGIRNGKVLAGQSLTIGETVARAASPAPAPRAQTKVAAKHAAPTKVAQAKVKPTPAAKSSGRVTKMPSGRTQVAYAAPQD
jgi:membrane-bound lytic murein transglycosylase D